MENTKHRNFISRYSSAAAKYAKAHKFISTVAVIVVIVGVYYWVKSGSSGDTQTRYVTATVQSGTLISSVTGSGQVSASTEFPLQPQASGNIVYVGVTDGQTVTAGTEIAQLDTTTQDQTIASAKANLENAQISLAKLQEPPTQLEITQDQDAITQSQQAVVEDQANLSKDYNTAFTAISNAFLDLPNTVAGVDNVLYKLNPNGQGNLQYYSNLVSNLDPTVTTYENSATSAYNAANAAYTQNFLDYKAVSLTSSTSTISALLNETYQTTQLVSAAVKSSSDLFSFVNQTLTENSKDVPSALITYQGTLSGYTGTTNSDLSSLLSSVSQLTNDQNALTNDTLSITVKQETLQELQAGPDPLDVQSSQLSVTQAQNALTTDEQNLQNYYVTAPFDGTVANLTAQVGDSAGSGSTLATLITKDQVAEITLNEIDAAKVKDGQQATLTFNAVPGLTIAGQVTDVSSIGTVSQGVVTYNVDVTFATQDPRVKPGMSVSVAIVTGVDQNVLLVPNSAIKTQGSASYVQAFNPPLAGSTGVQGAVSATAPQNAIIQTGDTNNTDTVVTSGLTAGEQIVIRTIVPTTSVAAPTATPSATSLLGGGGARGGFGGATGRATP